MKLPEIPTDNLYKFMAITGILLLIAPYLPIYLGWKAGAELARIKGESKIVNIEHDWMLKEVEILNHQIDTLIAQVVELTGISTSEIIMALNAGRSLSDIGKVKRTNLEKHQVKWEELEAKFREQLKLQREQIIKLTQLNTNLEVHNNHLKMLLWGKRLAMISASAGGFLTVFGFGCWYIKLQAPQDLIIKQKIKDAQEQ